jgi:formylglycine-generating enzyme required for sulfatase activity
MPSPHHFPAGLSRVAIVKLRWLLFAPLSSSTGIPQRLGHIAFHRCANIEGLVMRQIMFVFIFLFTMAGAASSESQEPSKKSKGTELNANLTNSLDMQFVKIPAGELQMGITENDAARLIQSRLVDWPLRDWKKKVHKVTLTMDYYIGKHEVTVGQFRKFVEATNYYTNVQARRGSPGRLRHQRGCAEIYRLA